MSNIHNYGSAAVAKCKGYIENDIDSFYAKTHYSEFVNNTINELLDKLICPELSKERLQEIVSSLNLEGQKTKTEVYKTHYYVDDENNGHSWWMSSHKHAESKHGYYPCETFDLEVNSTKDGVCPEGATSNNMSQCIMTISGATLEYHAYVGCEATTSVI